MTAQTNRLLRHSDLVGIYRRLGQQALLVHMDIAENLAHSREELFVIFFHGLRRTLFDKRDLVDYEIKARSNIILELSALDCAHSDKSFECFCRNTENIGTNLFFIFGLFRDGEDIIHSCKV